MNNPLSLQSYDGASDPSVWCERFELFRRCHKKMDAEEIRACFLLALVGDAEKWYLEQGGSASTRPLEEWKKMLVSRFSPKLSLQELQAMRMVPGESVPSFNKRFLEASKKTALPVPDVWFVPIKFLVVSGSVLLRYAIGN